MARETVFTAIIPAILIFFLVFFNIRKMQKQAKIMKMEHEGKCGGGCAGCAPQQKLSFREEGFIRKKRNHLKLIFSCQLEVFFLCFSLCFAFVLVAVACH
mgnify:CR=1 FL=1